MQDFVISRPTFGFIVATRVALGIGIGLLLSERLHRQRSHALGAALFAIGASTTVPAVLAVLRSTRRFANA